MQLPTESPSQIAWRFGRAFALLASLHLAGTVGFRLLGGPHPSGVTRVRDSEDYSDTAAGV